MDKNARRLRWIITIMATILAVAHLVRPEISIDSITITLLVIAVIPWLAPLFKSLEFPGGWKVEYRDIQRVAVKAQQAGLLTSSFPRGGGEPLLFSIEASRDPNLALANLRIEIERQLNQIAIGHEIEERPRGIGALLRMLREERILTEEEVEALRETIDILNTAVHGARVDEAVANWTLDYGRQLVIVLEERIPGRFP